MSYDSLSDWSSCLTVDNNWWPFHYAASLRVSDLFHLQSYAVLPRDVHEAFLVETEARPRPRPSELETETRLRRTISEARPSRGTTAPRDGLETEASRPKPHPWFSPVHPVTVYPLSFRICGCRFASIVRSHTVVASHSALLSAICSK